METYPLPAHSAHVHIALFTQLTNAATLRTRLITASTLPADDPGNDERAAVDFAFIDASMISSRLHLLTAINQALLAKAAGAMKTNTVGSEVIWQLDPGSNITESLKHFGLSPTTNSLVLVKVGPMGPGAESMGANAVDERTVLGMMKTIVEAKVASLDLLGRLPTNEDGTGGTNVKGLKKVYKLNGDPVFGGLVAGSEEERVTLDGLCISSVAVKTVA